MIKNCGGNKEAVFMSTAPQPFTAAEQPGAFALPDLNITKHRIHLGLIDRWAYINGLVKTIANF